MHTSLYFSHLPRPKSPTKHANQCCIYACIHVCTIYIHIHTHIYIRPSLCHMPRPKSPTKHANQCGICACIHVRTISITYMYQCMHNIHTYTNTYIYTSLSLTLTQTKVNQLNWRISALGGVEYILRLDVTVHDADLMQILYCTDYLCMCTNTYT